MFIKDIVHASGENVHTVSAGESVSAAARLLSDHGIDNLVVLGNDGHVQGVLSEKDILRGVAENCGRLCEMTVRELMTCSFAACGQGEAGEAAQECVLRQIPVPTD